MKRKIIAASLIACMVLVAVTSATLAYFTDKDALKNEFTIGAVDIDLWEIVGQDKDGKDITIGKDTDKAELSKHTYENLLPSDKITKEVHITNTSDKNAAYVRVTVVINNIDKINAAIDATYENNTVGGKYYAKESEDIQKIYNEVFDGWGMSYTKRSAYPRGTRQWMWSRVGEDSPVLCNIDTIANHGGYYRIDSMNEFMTEAERAAENGDGTYDRSWDAAIIEAEDLYYWDVVPDKNTRAYVFYLELDPNEDYVLFNGLKVPADFTEAQAAMFQGLKIDVYADAIQTTGFDGNWKAAFNALNETLPIGHWNAK